MPSGSPGAAGVAGASECSMDVMARRTAPSPFLPAENLQKVQGTRLPMAAERTVGLPERLAGAVWAGFHVSHLGGLCSATELWVLGLLT